MTRVVRYRFAKLNYVGSNPTIASKYGTVAQSGRAMA